jgi:hypothetical protein
MIISRRPNNRASIEKAPGPRRNIAAAITTIKKTASLMSKKFVVGIGNRKRVPLKLPRPMRTLVTEVRKPINRNTPLTIAKKPIPHIHRDCRSLSIRYTMP